jgi:hypothetical protein
LQEIRGLAVAAEIDFNELLVMNYIMELQSYCAAVVARAIDGTIIHARNADYFNTPILRNNTIYIAQFQVNGVSKFEGMVYSPSVGLLTTSKPNKFSISINQRTPTMSLWSFLQNIPLIFLGYEQPF